jgi:hypothetical protein
MGELPDRADIFWPTRDPRGPVQLILDAEAEAAVVASLDRLKGEDGWGLAFDPLPYVDCLAGRLKLPDLIAQETALAASTAYHRLHQVSDLLRGWLADHEPAGRAATPRKECPVTNLDDPCWRRRQKKLSELWEFVAFDVARNRLNIPETQVPVSETIRADWVDPGAWVPATLRAIQDTLPAVPPRWREASLKKARKAPKAERKAS